MDVHRLIFLQLGLEQGHRIRKVCSLETLCKTSSYIRASIRESHERINNGRIKLSAVIVGDEQPVRCRSL